jgi:hypothetical protein
LTAPFALETAVGQIVVSVHGMRTDKTDEMLPELRLRPIDDSDAEVDAALLAMHWHRDAPDAWAQFGAIARVSSTRLL